MKYTKWDTTSEAKTLFAQMDKAAAEPDQSKKLDLTQAYLDSIAEQAVLYPVVHTELMTAWNPKRLTGVQAQPYPGSRPPAGQARLDMAVRPSSECWCAASSSCSSRSCWA